MSLHNSTNCGMGEFPATWSDEENEILKENIRNTPREKYSELKYYTELMTNLPQKRLRDIVLRYRYLEQLKINPNEQWRDFWEKSRETKTITPTRSHSSSSGEDILKKSRKERRKSRSPQRQKRTTPSDSPRTRAHPMETESNTMSSSGVACDQTSHQMKIIDTGTSRKRGSTGSMYGLDEYLSSHVSGDQRSGDMETFSYSPDMMGSYPMNGMMKPMEKHSTQQTFASSLNSSLNSSVIPPPMPNPNVSPSTFNLNQPLNRPINQSLSSSGPSSTVQKGLQHQRKDTSPTRSALHSSGPSSMTGGSMIMSGGKSSQQSRVKIILNNPPAQPNYLPPTQNGDRKQYLFQPIYCGELDALMNCLNDGEKLIREIESDLIMSGNINIENVEAFKAYVINMIDQTTNTNGFELPQFTQRLIVYEPQQSGYSFAYLSDH